MWMPPMLKNKLYFRWEVPLYWYLPFLIPSLSFNKIIVGSKHGPMPNCDALPGPQGQLHLSFHLHKATIKTRNGCYRHVGQFIDIFRATIELSSNKFLLQFKNSASIDTGCSKIAMQYCREIYSVSVLIVFQ